MAITTLLLPAIVQASEWYQYAAADNALAEYRKQGASAFSAPLPDFDQLVRMSDKTPSSHWHVQEMGQYEGMLRGRSAKLMIAPVQMQEYGFALSQRGLMNALLAQALSARTESYIDPYLVSDALAQGKRRIEDADIKRVADQLGASRLVIPYVGTDQGRNISDKVPRRILLTLRVLELDAQGVWQEQADSLVSFEAPYSETHLPHEALSDLLPKVVAHLDLKQRRFKRSNRTGKALLPKAPGVAKPKALTALATALRFQLLAALSPDAEARTKDVFLERSLLALSHLPDDLPIVQRYRARAYLELGYRPKALLLLQELEGPAAEALRLWANGNVAPLGSAWTRISDDTERLMVGLSLLQLHERFDLDSTALMSELDGQVSKLPESWRPFASQRVQLAGTWYQPEVTSVKAELDKYFPYAGFSLNSVLLQGALSPSGVEDELSTATLRHVRSVLSRESELWTQRTDAGRASTADYLEFMRSWAIETLYRQAAHDIEKRANGKRGLETLERHHEWTVGQPDLTYLRARAYEEMADSAKARHEQRRFKEQAVLLGAQAMMWEGGQSRAARRSWSVASRSSSNTAVFIAARGDYPTFGYYGWYGERQPYLIDHFRQLEYIYKRLSKKNQARKLWSILENRFHGHPRRGLLLAKAAEVLGDSDKVTAALDAAIVSAPRALAGYEKRAESMLAAGQYQQAYDLLRSFPPFADGEHDRLALANGAASVGDLFYWRGQPELSRYFYEAAARTGVGSESQYQAQIRIATLDQAWQEAANVSMRRIQQYGSDWAKRDFVGLMLVMGVPDEADKIFNAFVSNKAKAPTWEAGMSVHRTQRMTDEQVLNWAIKNHGRNGQMTGRALHYSMQYFYTDRVLPENIGANIEREYGPTYRTKIGGGIHHPDMDALKKWSKEQKDGFIRHYHPVLQTMQLFELPNEKAMFYDAYRLLQLGELEAAAAAFVKANELHLVARTPSYLPAYAYAMASTKYKSHLSKELERVSSLSAAQQQRLGYELEIARMILDGFNGNHDEAVSHYHKALAVAEQNPKVWFAYDYEIGLALDRLYTHTNHDAYRELGASWARAATQTKPWLGWAHALHAKLVSDPSQRNDSLVKALYLDNDSLFLKGMRAKDLKAAERILSQGNPFGDSDEKGTGSLAEVAY